MKNGRVGTKQIMEFQNGVIVLLLKPKEKRKEGKRIQLL